MSEREKIKRKNIMDYLTIVFGSLIMASGLMFFLIPNKISGGGVSGISTIFYHIFGWKAGISMLAMNVPLFLIGVRIFGKKFGVKTLWGILWVSIFTDLIDIVVKVPSATHEPILAAIYGGLLMGIGLGIIMKGRGTTGGSDIVARILNKYLHISLGNSFILIDTVIIISIGIVFKDMDLILLCLITLVISSKIVDVIVEGNPSEKAITIITMKGEQIADRIINEVKRGITANISRGLYTNREKLTLYCVVSTRQIEHVRRIVKQEDPSAFVTVTNVAIMQGEGFRAQTTLSED